MNSLAKIDARNFTGGQATSATDSKKIARPTVAALMNRMRLPSPRSCARFPLPIDRDNKWKSCMLGEGEILTSLDAHHVDHEVWKIFSFAVGSILHDRHFVVGGGTFGGDFDELARRVSGVVHVHPLELRIERHDPAPRVAKIIVGVGMITPNPGDRDVEFSVGANEARHIVGEEPRLVDVFHHGATDAEREMILLESADSFGKVDDHLDTFTIFHIDADVFSAGIEIAEARCAAVVFAADFDDGPIHGGHEFFQIGELVRVAHCGLAFVRDVKRKNESFASLITRRSRFLRSCKRRIVCERGKWCQRESEGCISGKNVGSCIRLMERVGCLGLSAANPQHCSQFNWGFDRLRAICIPSHPLNECTIQNVGFRGSLALRYERRANSAAHHLSSRAGSLTFEGVRS
jgi:hypothetical protein